MRKPPLFIALEGIDGSGKSTQAALLAQALQGRGLPVHATFEPTAGFVGTLIRDILGGRREADHRTIAGLFVADRLDHILNPADGLLRHRAEGRAIVTDRYYFSSYAYHAVHMDMDWVIAANALAAGLLRPSATVFIDVAPETAMERIRKGRAATELYETLENLRQVRANYLAAFGKLAATENIHIVDGNRPPAAIAADIAAYVETLEA